MSPEYDTKQSDGETCQITALLKSDLIIWRVLETQGNFLSDLREKPPVSAGGKNLYGVRIIFIKVSTV